ncbi:hypothetical protein [uncultured Dokdonia sp.]|uniref:hypothetical protein n=1 Tax=uncultured Dokdonia sp. TaxID=575653 RepID=UPI00262A2361|nr:hypothetical protein [uncultured Dokdonia sp.]
MDPDGDCDCLEDDTDDEAIQRQLIDETTALSLFNLDLHRELRSNFLANYDIGAKYIAYYYSLSQFVKASDYNTSTLLKMISTLPEFNNAVNKILDPNVSESVIVINPDLRDELLDIVDELRLISSNNDLQIILDDIENDIIYLTNKTKFTIYNEIH